MSNIDRQRVAAVRKLEALGYRYEGDEWVVLTPTAATQQSVLAETDAMHSVLVQRADALEGCTEDEEAELKAIVDAIEAYEAKRWPLGKEPGGKG